MLEALYRLTEKVGIWRLLAFPVLAVGSALALTPLVGSAAAPAVALGLTLLAALVVLALVEHRLRAIDDDKARLERALSNLRTFLFEHHRAKIAVTLWHDEYRINERGDIDAMRRWTFRVEGTSPLHFVNLAVGGDSPLSRREKRRISFEVREVEGKGRLPLEVNWRGDNEAQLFAHLPRPLSQGESITVELVYAWPRTMSRLAKGGSERFTWRGPDPPFGHPIERLEYAIVLDPSIGRTVAVGYVLQGVPAPTQRAEAGGAWRIEGVALNLPEGIEAALTLDAGTVGPS
jgi:hypothetical protein